MKTKGRCVAPTSMLIKFLMWESVVASPLLACIFLLPAGFGGVPFVAGMLVVQLLLFVLLSVVVRSISMNCLVVGAFYLIIAAWHVIDHGKAPGQSARLLKGLLYIGLAASVHLAIQAAICWLVDYSRRKLGNPRP